MNDRTSLLVTYFSPSACLTTTAIIVNETVPCPIISQCSKIILKTHFLKFVGDLYQDADPKSSFIDYMKISMQS
jgi:hypothetical protein